MSTILHTEAGALATPQILPEAKGKFLIITADWNAEITGVLREGAHVTLLDAGIAKENIVSISVPGTVELINTAAHGVNREDTLAVIILGCVIRGETPHFDYVCNIASQGTASLNALGKAPVIFGVLTVDTPEQAADRAGGRLGNKGAEAAAAAVTMANVNSSFFGKD